jgi:hypothetical protein
MFSLLIPILITVVSFLLILGYSLFILGWLLPLLTTFTLVIVILPFCLIYKIIWVISVSLTKAIKLIESWIRNITLRLTLGGYQRIPDTNVDNLGEHFKKTLCRDKVNVHFVGAW